MSQPYPPSKIQPPAIRDKSEALNLRDTPGTSAPGKAGTSLVAFANLVRNTDRSTIHPS